MDRRDCVRTALYCAALGIVVVAAACAALEWLKSPGADWFWAFWNK